MVVQTVLGPIAARELGHAQMHEHVIIDIRNPNSPPPEHSEPVTIELDNYYETRRTHTGYSRQLLNEDDAIEELKLYAHSGGSTIVDVTSGGLSRSPESLARISLASGVHIVMGCGYYTAPYHPPTLASRSEGSLIDEIVAEANDGVGKSRIKPGIIGEIGMSWPPTAVEQKVLSAASRAQSETGLALMIHPGRHVKAPMEHIGHVASAGGDLSRTIMSHVDRTLFDVADMVAVAQAGVYVEFDLFGQESSFYPHADIDMPNDAQRVNYINALIEAGHVDRILVAQDICHKTHLRKYGGEGYNHLIDRVLPLMRRKGISDTDIATITRANPAKILDVAAP